MTRTTDCLKCNFPRDEPKGERVCRKCGRRESQLKGAAHRVVVDDPLAAFLPPLHEMAEALVQRYDDAEKLYEKRIEALMSPRALSEYPLDPLPPVAAEKPQGHSPLGGSGAKRWMNCTGSTALIRQLDAVDDDSEYSREGTQAHELAAWCLDNNADAHVVLGGFSDKYPLVKLEDAPYVQQYIDYVRSRPGRKRFEVPFHRPELHEFYRGVVDAECTPMMGDLVLEIIDYKHGAGVYVPVDGNPQGLYYAAGVLMEDEGFYPDDGVVRITIVQPRLTWMGEPIRSWDTTVGEIKRWLREECLPAMNVRTQDMVLSLGEWCQFCPAKLVCRAMTEVYRRFSGASPEPLAMSDEALGAEFDMVRYVKMRAKAVEQETLRRLMEGHAVPLAQLGRGRSDRVWKDENVVTSHWKEQAYEAKLRSPAGIEKLPGGKEFVAEWAYQPEAPLIAVPASSGRPAVQLPSPEERYGDASQYLVANKHA